mgnify:CR=1 FL=1
MWTKRSLAKKLVEYKGFDIDGVLTELLPLALDITENPRRMPYAYTDRDSDPISKVEFRQISTDSLRDSLTVQNYHAMLKYLEEHFRKNPEEVESQRKQGFRLSINFSNEGRPTRDTTNLFRLYTTIHDLSYCLSLSFGSDGYNAVAGPSKIRMQARCEDFLGPNRTAFF